MGQASSEEPVMNVLRNARHMAGWADEIGEEGLARRLIGKPMIEAAHAMCAIISLRAEACGRRSRSRSASSRTALAAGGASKGFWPRNAKQP